MLRASLRTALLSFCFATLAHAQSAPPVEDEVARNLFQAGRTAYDGGNYEDALSFFEQAQARSPRPQLLYNIGQAADRLRDDAKALASFKAYVAALPDAANRAEVENRIRALERTQSARPAPTTVAPRSVAPTPEQTALAATPAAPSEPLQSSPPTADDDPGVMGQWWFWTAIGVVVAGGVVTAVALSSGDTTQGPIVPASGVTVNALRGAL